MYGLCSGLGILGAFLYYARARVDMNGAHFSHSQGIVFTAGLLASGMSYASSAYIAYNKPASPLVFSDTMLATVNTHALSGHVVKVTSKTTGLIYDIIDRVSSKLGGGDSSASINKTEARAPGSMTLVRTQKPRLMSRLLPSTDMLHLLSSSLRLRSLPLECRLSLLG
jgi:hypothetical protein